jgi:probable biosynthetic protein (TIGR04098 family)
MTTFASRDVSNTGLLKGQPRAGENPVPTADSLPEFADGYRKQRSGTTETPVELSGTRFGTGDGAPLGELRHAINPYQDFNGVNLLYFAAYPTIADTCEREFVHGRRDDFGVHRDWALESSTVGRDVFYYGNCEIDDEIVYRLDEFASPAEGSTAAASTLSRNSDGERICSIFTVKERHR